jgi:hypothetical protein
MAKLEVNNRTKARTKSPVSTFYSFAKKKKQQTEILPQIGTIINTHTEVQNLFKLRNQQIDCGL